MGISNNSVCLEESKDDWVIFSTPEGQAGRGIITAQIHKFTGQITALSYMPSAMSDRVAGTLTDSYGNPDINISASAKEVKEEILKYSSTQQTSQHHQVAIDFIKTHNLNQEATIEKAQGIVESDTMLQLDFDKNGWKYLVEVALDNGKYSIVEIEKATSTPYGYYESSNNLEKRIDCQLSLKEKSQWIFE